MTNFAVLDDEALVGAAARGDRDALETLLERHAPMCAGIAFSVLANREDACDAVQAAMIRIAREPAADWLGRSFRARLCGYAHSAAVDLLRQNAGRKRREMAIAAVHASKESEMATDHAERAESIAALREELALLGEELATTLALYHLEGLPVADIARETGTTNDACRQRLSRGREQLRERLERRGLGVASVALLATLLDSLFGTARASATELPAAEFKKLARSAANECATSHLSPVAASRVAVSSLIPPADTTLSVGTGARSGNQSSYPQTLSNLSRPIVAATFLFALIGSAIWVLQSTKPVIVASHVEERKNADKQVDSASSLSTASTSPPVEKNQNVASRWQTPRFIDSMSDPVAITASQGHVALLAGDATKTLEPRTMTLMESSDAGETWATGPSVEGYMSGSVVIDDDNRCSCLLVAGAPFNLLFNQSPAGSRIEWRSIVSGAFGNPTTIWSAPAGSGYSLSTSLIHVPGGTWAFAVNKSGTRKSLDVAFGNSTSCPKPLTCTWQGGASNRPASWALDTNTAGFVLIDPKNAKQLVHCATSDRGATWSTSPVPFDSVSDSNSTFLTIEPELLTRDGNSLFLVAKTFTTAPKLTSAADMVYHRYVLISPDLGKTWSAPASLGLSESLADIQRDGILELCQPAMFSGRIVLGKTKIPSASIFADDRFQRPSAVVMTSEDSSKTWFNQHAFDALGKSASGLILTHDGASFHAALFRNLGNNKGCLVIRSFTAGTWRAPKESPPAWFKEEKIAEPTREEF